MMRSRSDYFLVASALLLIALSPACSLNPQARETAASYTPVKPNSAVTPSAPSDLSGKVKADEINDQAKGGVIPVNGG